MSYPADSYERYMVPALFGPWATRLVQVANPQPGEWVLDLACGTGSVTRLVAPSVGRAGRIFGYDVNADMLATVRSAAWNYPAIGRCQGIAERLGFPEHRFDLVVCQFGLMLFADRHAALCEIQRVMRKTGRFVLRVWQGLERHLFYQTLHAVSLRRLGKSGVQQVFFLGDADELHHLLREAGFEQVEIEPVSITARFPDPEVFLAWEIDVDPANLPAIHHLDPQAVQAVLTRIRKDMQLPLQAFMQAGVLVLPFHAYIVRASQ